MRKSAAKVVNARRKWRFCIVYSRICTDLAISYLLDFLEQDQEQ